MLKLIFFLVIGSLLLATNPTMKDAAQEAKRRVEEEQSTLRAGWSSAPKVTGLNWLTKQAGGGNYEFCRSNLYVASFYRIQDSKLIGADKTVGMMFGIAGNVWGWRIAAQGETQSMVADQLAKLADGLSFNECEEFHNAGEI